MTTPQSGASAAHRFNASDRPPPLKIDQHEAEEAFHLDPIFAAGYAAGAAEAAKLAEAKLAESIEAARYAETNSAINYSRSNAVSTSWGEPSYFQPPQGFGGSQRPPAFAGVGATKGKGNGKPVSLQSFGDVGADTFSYQGRPQGGPGGYSLPYPNGNAIASRNPDPPMTMQMPSGNLSSYHRNYFVRPTGVSPNTWRVHGELISRGAKNHPHNCVPCKFYCHGAGCLSGPNCGFCHEFHVSKSKFHAQRRAKGKGKGGRPQIPGDVWNSAPDPKPTPNATVCVPAQKQEEKFRYNPASDTTAPLTPAEEQFAAVPAPAPTATTSLGLPDWSGTDRSTSPPLW